MTEYNLVLFMLFCLGCCATIFGIDKYRAILKSQHIDYSTKVDD